MEALPRIRVFCGLIFNNYWTMNLLELRPVAAATATTATTLLVHLPSEIFFPIGVFSASNGLSLKEQKIGNIIDTQRGGVKNSYF